MWGTAATTTVGMHTTVATATMEVTVAIVEDTETIGVMTGLTIGLMTVVMTGMMTGMMTGEETTTLGTMSIAKAETGNRGVARGRHILFNVVFRLLGPHYS